MLSKRILNLAVIGLLCVWGLSFVLPSSAEEKPLPRRSRVLLEQRGDYFPTPAGTEPLAIANGSFEQLVDGRPAGGWSVPDEYLLMRTVTVLSERLARAPYPVEVARAMNMPTGEYAYATSKLLPNLAGSAWTAPAAQGVLPEVVSGSRSATGRAPHGGRYLRLQANDKWMLRSPDFDVRGGKPHLLSLWVRSDRECARSFIWYDVGLGRISFSPIRLPDTGGKWRRAGIYFRVPNAVSRARFHLDPGTGSGEICLDDVQLRTATEEEMSGAYDRWRAGYPPEIEADRPDIGRNLALTVAKLKGEKGIPGRPFVVFATGSSFTNSQVGGDAFEDWRQLLRSRFPQAPELEVHVAVGNSLPWRYCRGFITQQGIPLQPDLFLTYTGGDLADLEKMLLDIRRHSTADIIVPAMHLGRNNGLTPLDIEPASLDAQRQLCLRYGAEFIENRLELGRWLQKNGRQPFEIIFTNEDADKTHQNEMGRTLINENIVRSITPHPRPSYAPDDREKRLAATALFREGSPKVKFSGDWKIVDGLLVSDQKGAFVELSFEGNRIDLIGSSQPGGGSLSVQIDGQRGDRAPVFFTTPIKGEETNYPYSSRSSGSGGAFLHAVELGTNLVPQTWTIRMLDDEGNYELVGSQSKKDGRGNVLRIFKSDSGQITIDPYLWRYTLDSQDGSIPNRKGDIWTFDVYRSAVGSVSFKAEKAAPLHQPLVQNMTNGPHVLRLVVDGGGPVAIDSFYVFTPPMK